uniref:Uncharacterized protein n=1 Tax=Trichogramma kaykai TaxID=54128 RepID=A0ABD2VSL3_9HYME
MVKNKNNYNDYKSYIDIYDKLYPNKRRPRTLVILTDQDYDSDGSIKNLLQYGWTKKFLDVSLVEERHHCILQEYNPFIDTLSSHDLADLCSKLFPDKLINANGYKISVGVVTQDQLITILRNGSGQAIDLKNPLYDEIKIIMNFLNFSINSIVEVSTPGDYVTAFKQMVKKLQSNELSNMGVPRGYAEIYPNITHIFTEKDCFSINALVPLQTFVHVHLPFHIIIYLLTVILLVSFVTWISRLMRLFANKLSFVKVLGAFFGIPVIIRPSQASEVMILTNNRSSINVLLIQNKNDYDDYKNYIDIYDKLYPNKRRPRTLVILTDQDYDSDGSIKNWLQYGWTKKFLDVSLVEERHHCILQEYNPFIDTLSSHNLDDSGSKLFPDKLTNVYGYTFSIGAIVQDTSLTIIRNEDSQAIDLKTPLYDKIKIIMTYMNFSITSIKEANVPGDYAAAYKQLINLLENNELNAICLSRGLMEVLPNITSIFTERDCSSINALTPFRTFVQVSIPFNIIVYLFISILLIRLVTWISRLMRLFANKLSFVKVFGALFGVPVTMRPTQSSEVMLLTSIFLLSIIYPSNFYSSFVKDKLQESPATFNSYQEIYESGLPVFIFVSYAKLIVALEDPFVHKILQKSILNKYSEECVKLLLSGEERICVSSYEALKKFIQWHYTNTSLPVTISHLQIGCIPCS